MDSTEGLCNSRPSLVLGQSIQPLKNSLYIALLEEQFLCELHCGTLSHGQCIYVIAHSRNRPCLICLVARANTESSSSIILMIMSVIIGVGGIVV
jgi:hypothetical protein